MKKQVRKVKRLQLSRETLVRLTNEELKEAQGGLKCTGCVSGCGFVVDA
jgi:hypothetical protein